LHFLFPFFVKNIISNFTLRTGKPAISKVASSTDISLTASQPKARAFAPVFPHEEFFLAEPGDLFWRR
jgi:hypothetical protein